MKITLKNKKKTKTNCLNVYLVFNKIINAYLNLIRV